MCQLRREAEVRYQQEDILLILSFWPLSLHHFPHSSINSRNFFKLRYSKLYMNPFNTERKLSIPLYSLLAVTAGFYVGYQEGKGIDVGTSLEYITKCGPTVFAVGMTPLLLKSSYALRKFMLRKGRNALREDEPDFERKSERLDNLETRTKKPEYLKSTVRNGTITAAETLCGYLAGRVFSQLS